MGVLKKVPHSAGMSFRYFLSDKYDTYEIGHKHSSLLMLDDFNYDDYYKFATVRNHWDWFKAMFAFMIKNDGGIYEFEWDFIKENGLDFNKFIDWYLDQSSDDLYGGNREVNNNIGGLYHWLGEEARVCDDFITFSKDGILEREKKKFLDKIDTDDYNIPHVNKNTEGYNKADIFYNYTTKEKVCKKYKREIDFFNFETV